MKIVLMQMLFIYFYRNANVDLFRCHVVNQNLSSKFRNGTCRSINFCLGNLKEFHLFADEAITNINPYDIVSFLKNCTNVESVFLDVSISIHFICTYLHLGSL